MTNESTRPVVEVHQRLPRAVQLYWALQLGLGALFLVWSFIYWRRGYKDVVHGWPFFGFEYFHDFWVFLPRFAFLHQSDFFSSLPSRGILFPYPAPVGLLYAGFYALPRHRYIDFLLVTLGVLLVFTLAMAKAMRRRGVSPWTITAFLGTGVVFSYPFWFEYLGGNMEVCIFLLVALGVVAFLSGHDYVAATLFGIATSMKLFPLVYFGLFLARKQFRQIAWGAVVTVASTVGSLWLLCPSIRTSWAGIQQGVGTYQTVYLLSIRTAEAGFDHSLFSVYRDVYSLITRRPITPGMLHVYLGATACIGIVLFFTAIIKLPLLNQVCALVIASIWLTPISYDYTLLHLFVPLALLVLFSLNTQRAAVQVQGTTLALLCFAVLLAPECELIARHTSVAGVLKSVVLLVLFVTVLRCPFQDVETGKAAVSS